MPQNLNTTFAKVYQKIRTLARECSLEIEPLKKEHSTEHIISNFMDMLEQIRKHIINISKVQEDYDKLEKIVQKYEQDIRKHIALEQQLKLYSESIQQQLDESQMTRKDFLQNTKKMIVQLKRGNQKLYEQNISIKQQLRSRSKNLNFSKPESSTKKRRKADASIQEFQRPLKTQYIQINHTPKNTIKVKVDLQKRQRSSNNLNLLKKREPTSLKKKQTQKQGKIRTQTRSYISLNDIDYLGKQNSKTIDPDQKRKTQKLKQTIKTQIRQKHYKSHETYNNQHPNQQKHFKFEIVE